eukprot:TRINITY_DN9498_c0_g1_i3.p1 TRINITY_DN9498_c0_g1~~TRINITY_DN9498_c0_g1_i3.p1  ORF type:complete len:398 (+),score=19.85 TRINITY_DN9498_c0_g1_i3:266-1459(+)
MSPCGKAITCFRCNKYQCEIDSSVLITLKSHAHHLRPKRYFSEKDMLALGEVLLKIDNPVVQGLTSINLHHSNIGSNGAIWLAKVLETNPYLQSINLSNNDIGPRGARAFARLLERNTKLRDLNLHGNSIYHSGALALSQAIKKNSNLQSLDLSSNNIGFLATSYLRHALQNHSSIVDCDLEANHNLEEILNSTSHAIALIFSIIGAVVLLSRLENTSFYHKISCTIFCLSLIMTYTSSTLFHGFFKKKRTHTILRIMDHASIYTLIAGTYTPFLMIHMHHNWGFPFLIAVWTYCVIGVSVEAFFMDRYPILSTSLYIGMGWMIVLVFKPFLESVPINAVYWLAAGGLFYTGGVYFYKKETTHPIHHTIWHVFVFFGSLFHYLAILFYIAPASIPLS